MAPSLSTVAAALFALVAIAAPSAASAQERDAAASDEEPPLPAGLEQSAAADDDDDDDDDLDGDDDDDDDDLDGDDEPALPAGLDDDDSDDDGDDDEPALPAGLDDSDDGPPLPTGLDEADGDGPPLPMGLADGDGGDAADRGRSESAGGLPFEWRTSADFRAGSRVVSADAQDTLSIAELRLQLEGSTSWRPWSTTARVVLDVIGDPLADVQSPKLESGLGALDLRVASLTLTPSERVDLRIGRQILTWGTGDLLFVNDLFPKDWTAFLIGRDVDYLKAPSDALKVAVFTPVVGVDVVLTPRFDADRLPRRERLSSWEPTLGRVAGEDVPIVTDTPDEWIADGEVAVRLHRALGSWELAGYGYYGFWKSPAGADPMTGAATFPALSVYGASVRGPVLRGIANAEVGYYDSRDDRAGDDPMIRNSELRAVAGYERQLARDVTASAQYYLEAMVAHDDYVATLPMGMPAVDELRHVLTARLRWLALEQRLQVSLYAAASPSDRDLYLRPTASYAVNDRWTAFAGGNLLAGTDEHTFFGQLEDNSNVYLGVRFAR